MMDVKPVYSDCPAPMIKISPTVLFLLSSLCNGRVVSGLKCNSEPLVSKEKGFNISQQSVNKLSIYSWNTDCHVLKLTKKK